MELMNEFEVAVPVDQVWAVLTDLRRLTPCVPGAHLDRLEDGELRGVLDVTVGPIDARYEARSAFADLDDADHTIILAVNGHDTNGQGDATASITLDLEPRGDRTLVSVVADLSVSGKVAQFGRSVLAEVSNELMEQFVDNLKAELSGATGDAGDAARVGDLTAASAADDSVVAAAAAARGASEPGVRAVPRPEAADAPAATDEARTPALVAAGVVGTLLVVVLAVLLRRRSAGRR